MIIGLRSDAEVTNVASASDASRPRFACFVPVCDQPKLSTGERSSRASDLEELLRSGQIRTVFVSRDMTDPATLAAIVKAARRTRAVVRAPMSPLSPRLRGEPLGLVRDAPSSPCVGTPFLSYETWKRVMDVGIAVVVLTLTMPLVAVIALLVRATSPGPVLFRQARVSKDGLIFMILKFRTMVAGAEETLSEVPFDPTQPFFKLRAADHRITRLGRFLRRWSIDELPQLMNVLRGEMSVIGPRPLPLDQVLASPELMAARHSVLPGLTGWWQVNGRADLDASEALTMDRFYVDHRSLRLDLTILARTLAAVVSRRGAY